MYGIYSHRVKTCSWDYQQLVCSPSACLPTCPSPIFLGSPPISDIFKTQLSEVKAFVTSQSLGHRAWHLRSFRYTPLFRCFSFPGTKPPTPTSPLCPLKGHPCEAAEVHRDIISDSHRFQQSVTGFYSRKSNIL